MMTEEHAEGSPSPGLFHDEARPTDRIGDYGEAITSTGTVSRLRRGVFQRRKKNVQRMDTHEVAKGKLGMIEGVFFRVLTNLFGVILFLRLGWLTGYAGIGLSIVIICLSSLLTMITALSLSAICTNGRVAAGGAYYLISRALGPEFGGSIGVLFYIATTVSVSLYLLGFAETVVNNMSEPLVSDTWDQRLFAFFALIFCQLVCLVGVSVVVRVEKFMLFILLIAILLFIIGVFVGPTADDNVKFPSFVPLGEASNFGPDFLGAATPLPTDLSYLQVENLTHPSQCVPTSESELKTEYGVVNMGISLAVFFPAVTGILAGANISGDLKNPSYAIPTGTVSAIVLGMIIYIFLVCLFGESFHRTSVTNGTLSDSGVIGEHGPEFDCTYGGLYHDSLIISKASVSPAFVLFGIYAASISSGLAALLGAPRILQALARDRLFSTFDPLAKGYGKSDEPLRAYAVTFIIALLCILTGDINTVAPLITTFFLSSYAMVNYACFSAEESKSPGWRPTFRYFDRWLAFFGALGCLALMLFLSAITGFVTFTIGLALYKYVEVSNREGLGAASNWGPHKEAAEYMTALRAALLLEESASSFASPHTPAQPEIKPVNDDTAEESHTEIELGAHDNIVSQRYPGQRRGSRDDLEEEEDEDDRATFSGHEPLFDTTHVKNYRPQCLVLSGPPQRRPALAVFVAGLRKARGVTVFGDILVGDLSDPDLLRVRNTRAGLSYVAKYGIKAFNDVIIAPSFRTGCRSLLQLSGLGRRMRINTVVLGFLDDWKIPQSQRVRRRNLTVEPTSLTSHAVEEENNYSPPPSVVDYVGVIGDAFDLGLGVAILRGELNLLRSEYLTQTIRTEMERVLTLGFGKATDHFSSRNGAYLNPNYAGELNEPRRLQSMMSTSSHETVDFDNDPNVANNTNSSAANSSAQPKVVTEEEEEATAERKSAKRIDVWWLVDDGGLSIMLPHMLRQAKSPPWVGCTLQVMAIGATDEEVAKEQANMEKLMSKLRITAFVKAVSLESLSELKSPSSSRSSTRKQMDESSNMENVTLQDDDGNMDDTKQTNMQRQLFRAYSSMDETQNKSRQETYRKVGKLIRHHSDDALLVVVSLPVPPMSLDPEEYMHWLDLLSKDCGPPVLMVRGSQRDVVTMFS